MDIAPVHEALLKHVREKVDFYEIDREIWPDILEVEKMIRSGEARVALPQNSPPAISIRFTPPWRGGQTKPTCSASEPSMSRAAIPAHPQPGFFPVG